MPSNGGFSGARRGGRIGGLRRRGVRRRRRGDGGCDLRGLVVRRRGLRDGLHRAGFCRLGPDASLVFESSESPISECDFCEPFSAAFPDFFEDFFPDFFFLPPIASAQSDGGCVRGDRADRPLTQFPT